MRNGSVTPREEGFAKQTQVMLLGGWSADDVTAEACPVSINGAVARPFLAKKMVHYGKRLLEGSGKVPMKGSN